jgi:hypothetical protein
MVGVVTSGFPQSSDLLSYLVYPDTGYQVSAPVHVVWVGQPETSVVCLPAELQENLSLACGHPAELHFDVGAQEFVGLVPYRVPFRLVKHVV